MGTWDTTLVIKGSKGSPNRHLGIQVCIFIDFKSFWEASGTHFGYLFVIFLCFGMPEWETGSRSMFLVIQGSKGSPNRHLEVQVCIFSDSVRLRALQFVKKARRSFPVDPGSEVSLRAYG